VSVTLETALIDHFGFDAFRPGQREAVEAALAGRDVLVVMPTGAGKSLCYQLPALARGNLTVVVSPLVSLMQDQVDGLAEVAPGAVALVNAQQDYAENRAVLDRAVSGDLRLLYVAPERFASPGFAERLKQADVGLFVVDEAHCVSQWGHDFRPDYFRLADAARYVGARAIFAATATATPQVARDIVSRLGLRDPVSVTTGFDRPNLSFAVVRSRSKADKHARIGAALAQEGALPAIVYAGTRRGCDSLAPRLATELGEEVLVYHAGLGREKRAEVQRRFMAGEAPVVVATNAFGMGVDKANVRTVCHETVPGSVEAFYQEAGRAGRDGKPSRCLLFAENRDKGLHVFFIERSQIAESAFAAVANRLAARSVDGRYDLGADEVKAAADIDDADGVRAVIGHLARAGVIQPAPSSMDRVAGRMLRDWDGTALAQCRAAARDAVQARWRQYRAVWQFVESDTCRRRMILRHFGDEVEPAEPDVPCCDVCSPDLAADLAALGPIRATDRRPGRAAHPGGGAGGGVAVLADVGTLDEAILTVVRGASPGVGRTRAVEILRGGGSKVIRQNSYDGLPGYGTFAHLSSNEVLGRVDELLQAGRLRSTGGRFPKLKAAA
jgi:ATP-dependent DNA helicase RecQ